MGTMKALKAMLTRVDGHEVLYSPAARAEDEARVRVDAKLARGGQGRTRAKAPVCPARAYAGHPDAGLRELAEAQAREAHRLNDYLVHGTIHPGKCWAKACRAERTGVRVTISRKRRDMERERGW